MLFSLSAIGAFEVFSRADFEGIAESNILGGCVVSNTQ